MFIWIQIFTACAVLFAIGQLTDLKKSVDKLQRQVEHLHNVMLSKLDDET